MILSDKDIIKGIKNGDIEIYPLDKSQIGSASVDLTMSNRWWFFKEKENKRTIGTDSFWKDEMYEIKKEEITLKPKEMCLGITKEKIKLSDRIAGMLQGRSRYARMGLSVHITSSFVHPGVDNHQVLEIVNNSPFEFKIKEGDKISQIIFFYTKSKTSKPYKKFGEISVDQ